MSTLKVDSLVEKTSGNGVHIPEHIIQSTQSTHYSPTNGNLGRIDINTLNTYTDVMNASITTKSANSKILVFTSCVAYSGSNVRGRGKLFRNSTQIVFDPYAWHYTSTDMQPWVVNLIDTPSVAAGTTLTYKIQAANAISGTTLSLKYSDSQGTTFNALTLMEIAQ